MKTLDFSAAGFTGKLARFCAEANTAPEVTRTVTEIIAAVRERGDAAVLEFTEKFDRAKLRPSDLRVPAEELAASWKKLPAARKQSIRDAISCVKAFHKKTLPRSWRGKNPHGATVGENFYPLKRVGINVPGGRVPLVSTVVMTTVLAKLAGVPEVVVCTPPLADGTNDPGLLAALHACGVTEVYRMGGIQAMAALGLGTKTVPAVDKLFGPGNAYVMEAKRQLFGLVGVDLLPGPSEVMVIADESANPRWTAADLLAQAEHGTGKEKIYLACTDKGQLEEILAEVKKQMPALTHATAIAKVLDAHFLSILVPDLDAAVEVANFIAPEHLELHVADGELSRLTAAITTAGAIMQGSKTPTVLGDFTAGPSHTLPTGRTGRFFSGLQVTDFMRRSSVIRYDERSLAKAKSVVEAFSELERLDGHGRSLAIRLEH